MNTNAAPLVERGVPYLGGPGVEFAVGGANRGGRAGTRREKARAPRARRFESPRPARQVTRASFTDRRALARQKPPSSHHHEA